MGKLKLTQKYIDFLKYNKATVEFLEGTTYAGKTTIGAVKFFLRVATSNKKYHAICGLDLGTIEKNIINKEFGALDIFSNLLTYFPNGKGANSLPHLIFNTTGGEKIIYFFGYDTEARWKKALGGQYGCIFIDEFNIANEKFVNEILMRCDYAICTMNPDDPTKTIYAKYINKSRPLKKYENDVPNEILQEFTGEKEDNWTYWFFTFQDNAGLTTEKMLQIQNSIPRDTKAYKNKILGLRGKATGIVFVNFSKQHIANTIKFEKMYKEGRIKFQIFTCGVDTAYSENSDDTIAFIFAGITTEGQCVILNEYVKNNKGSTTPLSPSDVVNDLINFLNVNIQKWGLARDVYIDNADQATIMELKKYKRKHGCVYIFYNAYKKMKIVDRINLQLGYFAKKSYIVLDCCNEHIRELNAYCWKENKYEPEDRNDHTINASQYAWIPYTHKITYEGE